MKERGCVAAGDAATAEAAQIILREGGNAFDAALAALCASFIAEPVLSSLGGGGFLLARHGADDPVLYDFFSQTPKRRRPREEVDFFPILADFGTVTQEFHIGMGSIAVPGIAKGLFDVHRDLCSMPLRRIVEPAAKLAREGVRIRKFQAYILEIVEKIYSSNAECRRVYAGQTNPDGLLGEGDRFALPDLADMLEALAEEGSRLFYEGEIGRKLVADCREKGGYLTAEDLTGYEVHRRKPLRLRYGDASIHTNPPPSTGGLLILFALGLLKDAGWGGDAFGTSGYLEKLTSTMALTNKARVDGGLHEGDERNALLDPDFLSLYAAQVHGRPEALRGTTQVSVIDNQGNAASMTVSNGEGAAYLIPGTGVMMNNMLGEEDINPLGFNNWPEDIRMCSMMAPSLVYGREGEIIALGSGGSNRIRTAILQTLLNHLDFGMSLTEAVEAPRIHFERGMLNIEPGFGSEITSIIGDVRDHKVWSEKNLFFGGVHGVAYDTQMKSFDGVGDPRRGGVSLIA